MAPLIALWVQIAMQIRALKRLVGPSIWANYPVLEAWVDLGKYEDFPSNTLPGFNEKLMRWLPTMIEHRCSIGERGGFFQRMETGTWLGHVLEHVTLEIQSLAHSAVGFGRARETSERGVYKVAIEVLDFRFGEACLNVAHEMILAAAEGRDYDLPASLAQLAQVGRRLLLRPEHASDRRRRTEARHPHAASDRRQPGATRLRQSAAPHLDRRNR